MSNTPAPPEAPPPESGPASLSLEPTPTPIGQHTLDEQPPSDSRRFGAFGGVFTPSILTILGVIMYLRFGEVVGNIGLVGALAVVVLSHLISLATGLSVAAIATNRTVGPGGAYYMISRSLGAPVGASIGIPLFLAQALSITFYVVGFCESVGYLWDPLNPNSAAFDPTLFKIIGSAVLMVLTLITLKSTDLALKTQYVVMAAIVLSLLSFLLGRAEDAPEDITWFVSGEESFSEMFALFFPAVTGIMAGVSMSGDLKDPRRALPRGTIAAILVGWLVYLIFPIWLAMNADPETLRTSQNVVWDISAVPALIFAGVWGATLSSAVGSILAAPRTIQALAVDGLSPGFLAKGSGPANEPRAGLAVTYLIAQAGILLGDLNAIAPVLTMFFLATYGVTNLASALEKWAASPSFRPTFRVPSLVSLFGAIACFYVMSIINMAAMLVATLVCGTIYVVTQRRMLTSTFGDARHGIWSAMVRSALIRLKRAPYHAMNWRPNLVIMGGHPNKRRHLLELGSALVQDRGLVSYFMLLRGDVKARAGERREALAQMDKNLEPRFPHVFFKVDVVDDVYRGAVQVAQSYGIGSFEANTVLLGWPKKIERAEAYTRMLTDLTQLDRSLLLVNHDAKRGYGDRAEIHIWWGGLAGNGGLMLLMAQLIKSHHAWRKARVITLTVVDDDEGKTQAAERLAQVFESARVEAETRIIRRDGRAISEIMAAEGANADLSLVGLRMPGEGEAPEDFIRQYTDMMAALNTTLLVHSARTFDGAPVLLDET
ncbi:MAG: Na-K-Cl cotransporter [Bradymonadia bacterium]